MRPLLSVLTALCALVAPIPLHTASALAATAATAPQPRAEARVIVKFKTDSTIVRRHALSARTASAETATQRHIERAQALGQRVGMTLRAGGGMTDRMQVVFASGITSEQLAARLSKEADVEYAVVDHRRRRAAAPNDPLYLAVGGNGPASGQWYLRAPLGEVQSSINVEPAWDITTGGSVVVAVLDTGVRFDHPDLAGKLLAGYDMIHDPATANDGNGRDADASDAGDFVTQSEVDNDPAFADCKDSIGDSSWHGTQTAGVIGAATNNGVGMASVGRNVKILPVRVLGKCGGYDSDIQAGMLWAAGLAVPGLPVNPNPAWVINMSLGDGAGSCSTKDGTTGSSYDDVIAQVQAAPSQPVIVASGGNSAGHTTQIPAKCNGVIGVTALRHVGSKVGFSDMGPEISISAPGGNCVNTGTNDPCLYPILTTSNSGTTNPVAGPAGAIYTDSFNVSLGTSFSAPLVAGTAALMLAVDPTLTPLQVKLLMQGTARPFPTTGGSNGDGSAVLECTAPQYSASGSAVDQLQCYCSTGTCGAGMVDAGLAVAAAQNGTAIGAHARIDISPQQPVAQQSLQLSGANSLVDAGRSISTYQWALLDGGGIVSAISNATAATATVMPTAAGRFKVRLTVLDSAGHSSTADLTLSVNAAPVTPPPAPAPSGGGGGALGWAWLLALAAAVLALRGTQRSLR